MAKLMSSETTKAKYWKNKIYKKNTKKHIQLLDAKRRAKELGLPAPQL